MIKKNKILQGEKKKKKVNTIQIPTIHKLLAFLANSTRNLFFYMRMHIIIHNWEHTTVAVV